MVKINIEGNESIIDPFYRYKMNKLNVTFQKNKTIIDNIHIVASDLHVDVQFIIYYFKKRMSIAIDYKKETLTTNGKIEYSQWEKYLKDFIDLIILCPNCSLPELIIDVEKNNLTAVCNSCPHTFKYNIDDDLNKQFIKILMSKPKKDKNNLL